MRLHNDIHVICGTHWDREWQFAFEHTRMMLVEAMDALLDMLDNDPEGTSFHLDGQTIPVVDYLEVRPENRDRLCRHVREGRLLIGPWLVLPEENQMSGESLVRNLLWGARHGREFGGRMTVGYSPTSWGQVSQMPQIFREAGVDSIIFYRGLDLESIPGHYYVWEGPDGSRLLGVRLGGMARYGFQHNVIRPLLLDRGPTDRGQRWADGGKPVRLCGSGAGTFYTFTQPPMGWYPERLEQAFADLIERDLGAWETTVAPAFACDDSIGPIPAVSRIIREADQRAEEGRRVVCDTLPALLAALRKEIDEAALPVLTGEMRHTAKGAGKGLYAEIQAARMPTKYANRRAECDLQRLAEPLSTVAWMLGDEYPRFQLDRANFLLLANHAHDSIGGCGHDRIDEDVRERFRQVRAIAAGLAERGVHAIAKRIDTGDLAADEVLLVVVNTLGRQRSAVVEGEVDFELGRNLRGFRVENLDGAELPVQMIAASDTVATFHHPQETPAAMPCHRLRFLFEAPDVPALGYRVFRIALGSRSQPGEGGGASMAHEDMPTEGYAPSIYNATGEEVLIGATLMENEHLRVSVNADGTADVTCRESGTTLRGQNAFEDGGEVGDYWMGRSPQQDRIVTSLGGAARIIVLEKGPLCAAIEATVRMELPVRATPDREARAEETRLVEIRTVYRLRKGERFLRIKTTIENTVEDHLLRALFPTCIDTDVAHAQVPFDVVVRSVRPPDDRDWAEPYRPGQPQRSFVDLSGGGHGVAVLNRGLPHYEARDDADRTVALTLLRCHPTWNSIRNFPYSDQNGTQLLGSHTFDYALMPHGGDWHQGGVGLAADAFNIDPLVAAAGPGAGTLPTAHSFVHIDGDGVMLHAVKQGEWDETLVVRLSNPGDTHVDARLTLGVPFERAESINALEDEVKGELATDDRTIAVPMAPKQIATVRVTLRRTDGSGDQ